MTDPYISYLGVGSNLGDRLAWLRLAVDKLHALAVSPVYQTEPVGGPSQDDYYNIVVQIETFSTPQELLAQCHAIEQLAGRERTVRNGPRTLDVDILLYGAKVVNEPGLQIPHPRMDVRNFVITPLQDLLPSYKPSGDPEGEVTYLGELVDLADTDC